ncbi:MAG: PAS domain-containing protein [Rhodospirillaceae bacterium]|nr:PAS domain-containing protein [Rhodospirillaceae bacterium]
MRVLNPDVLPDVNRQTKPPAVPRDVEAFLKHWQMVPKTGLMPTLRAFLDARPFKHQSDVGIVDVISPTEMRFRLFGSGLSTIAGHDLTGSDVLSNFHPDAHADASRMAWSAVSVPCGYIVCREMRRDAFETTAVGIGLPLLHEKSGRPCIVGFSSVAGKTTDIVHSDRSPFVRAVELIKWIDIGAGTPNG